MQKGKQTVHGAMDQFVRKGGKQEDDNNEGEGAEGEVVMNEDGTMSMA